MLRSIRCYLSINTNFYSDQIYLFNTGKHRMKENIKDGNYIFIHKYKTSYTNSKFIYNNCHFVKRYKKSI